MMIRSTSLVFLSFLAASLAAEEPNCDSGTILYEDIGCTAAIKDGEKCPYKYECPEFKSQEDSCHFRGRTLAVGESLDNDEIYSGCAVGCRCSGSSQMTCAILDCPEWLRGLPRPGCRRTYDVGKCCSTGQVCQEITFNPTGGYSTSQDDSKNCTIGGKTYKEGDRFSVEDRCLKCVCKEGFNGELTEEFCEKPKCNVELRESEKLENKCAAVYLLSKEEDPLCCPSGWLCPSGDEDIKKVNTEVEDEGLECEFGSKTLKLGEGFESSFDRFGSSRDLKCECKLPPIVSCIGIY